MQHRNITFIGAGNMAGAIIAGLVKGGYPADKITVCAPTPQRREALTEQYGVISSHDTLYFAQQAEVLVLAVKPQIMAEVCHTLQTYVDLSNKLVISIAAGISCQSFAKMLGEPLNLIRVMPNTPSLISQGMSGLYAPPNVSEEDRTFASDLMKQVGEICWVTQEREINLVIAAAGSAPAYFFLFMEAMQQEVERQGLDATTARQLIQQTANGAAAMVKANPHLSFATLREQVTSKGGTTAEALKVFHQHHLSEIIAQAMQAAIQRAQEMESQF